MSAILGTSKSDTQQFFLMCVNSWIAFNATFRSFWRDTSYNAVTTLLLTKMEGRMGVIMMEINMKDGNDGLSQWRESAVLDLISICDDTLVQAKLEGSYCNHNPPFKQYPLRNSPTATTHCF